MNKLKPGALVRYVDTIFVIVKIDQHKLYKLNLQTERLHVQDLLNEHEQDHYTFSWHENFVISD